jgi:hypothetical protein
MGTRSMKWSRSWEKEPMGAGKRSSTSSNGKDIPRRTIVGNPPSM